MRLILSARAVRRLGEIADFIAADNPRAALRVEAAIRNALALIAAHPYAGRAIRLELRRLVVPRVPYVILYRLDERVGQITVATIRHTSQRPILPR